MPPSFLKLSAQKAFLKITVFKFHLKRWVHWLFKLYGIIKYSYQYLVIGMYPNASTSSTCTWSEKKWNQCNSIIFQPYRPALGVFIASLSLFRSPSYLPTTLACSGIGGCCVLLSHCFPPLELPFLSCSLSPPPSPPVLVYWTRNSNAGKNTPFDCWHWAFWQLLFTIPCHTIPTHWHLRDVPHPNVNGVQSILMIHTQTFIVIDVWF